MLIRRVVLRAARKGAARFQFRRVNFRHSATTARASSATRAVERRLKKRGRPWRRLRRRRGGRGGGCSGSAVRFRLDSTRRGLAMPKCLIKSVSVAQKKNTQRAPCSPSFFKSYRKKGSLRLIPSPAPISNAIFINTKFPDKIRIPLLMLISNIKYY